MGCKNSVLMSSITNFDRIVFKTTADQTLTQINLSDCCIDGEGFVHLRCRIRGLWNTMFVPAFPVQYAKISDCNPDQQLIGIIFNCSFQNNPYQVKLVLNNSYLVGREIVIILQSLVENNLKLGKVDKANRGVFEIETAS